MLLEHFFLGCLMLSAAGAGVLIADWVIESGLAWVVVAVIIAAVVYAFKPDKPTAPPQAVVSKSEGASDASAAFAPYGSLRIHPDDNERGGVGSPMCILPECFRGR